MLQFKKSLNTFCCVILFLCVNALGWQQVNAQCNMGITNDWTALKALYDSTSGPQWINRTGWDTIIENQDGPPQNCDLSTLFGVRLDEEGRVDCIDLDGYPDDCEKTINIPDTARLGNDLEGRLPEELSLLTNLTHLNLANHFKDTIIKEDPITRVKDTIIVKKINGSIPASLGSLENLVYLEISFHELEDTIPVALTQLTNLETLALYANQLTGSIPPQIGDLSSLRIINCSGNELSGEIPIEIAKLQNLEEVYFNVNKLSGSIPDTLVYLPNLDSLSLSKNQFSGNFPSSPRTMSNLSALWISNNQLSGIIPEQIGNFLNLEKLVLSNNRLIGKIPQEIGELDRLKWLFLTNNQLIGEIPFTIGNLKNLEILFLNENLLSGKIPPQLGNSESLKQLWLSSNNLNGPIPEELGELTNLTFLYLSANELSGEIPDSLGKLINLDALGLSGNLLSGSIPGEITNLENLTQLWLNGNALTELTDFIIPENTQRMGISFNSFDCVDIQVFENNNSDFINNNFSSYKTQFFTPGNYELIRIRIVEEGETISIEPSINNIDAISYQWFKNDTVPLSMGQILEINNFNVAENSGIYKLHITTNCSGATFVSEPIYVRSPNFDFNGSPIKATQLMLQFDDIEERMQKFETLKQDLNKPNLSIIDSCNCNKELYLIEFDSAEETQQASLIINQRRESVEIMPELDSDNLFIAQNEEANFNRELRNIIGESLETSIAYKIPSDEMIYPSDDTVNVYLLDTGLNLESLANQNNLYEKAPFYDDCYEIEEAQGFNYTDIGVNTNFDDSGWHGTYGFKAISELNNNADIKIIPLKAFTGNEPESGSLYDLVCAIYHAVDNNADVINISAGFSGQPSDILEEAIEYALKRGVFIVTAAGNDNSNLDTSPQYPAFYAGQSRFFETFDDENNANSISSEPYNNVISVASINSEKQRSSFSNFGSNSATLAAYGENLLINNINGSPIIANGTSMAAFFVTRELALEIASNKNRDFDTIREDFIKKRLVTNTTATSESTAAIGADGSSKILKVRLEAIEVDELNLEISITDPCDCTNGIDLDNDGIIDLVQEIIVVNSGTPPFTVTTLSNNFYGISENVLSNMDIANQLNNSNNSATVYVKTDGSTHSITIEDALGLTDSVEGGPCLPCPGSLQPETIPTLSQWGIIILMLLFFTLSNVMILKEQHKFSAANLPSKFSSKAALFNHKLFYETLVKGIPLMFLSFAVFSVIDGGLFIRNLVGVALSYIIVVYYIHFIKING